MPADTLRGIMNHRFVHPLHSPGAADLSVDVDFASLRRAALSEAPELRCPPLTLQRDFLAAMVSSSHKTERGLFRRDPSRKTYLGQVYSSRPHGT